MPVMRWRVVCALRDVMLIFWPTSALSKVDLPTLGLPTMAIRPQRCSPTGGTLAAGRALSAGTAAPRDNKAWVSMAPIASWSGPCSMGLVDGVAAVFTGFFGSFLPVLIIS